MKGAVATLVHAWLVLDFFGDARRTGGAGSTLTTTIFSQSFLGFVFAALLYPETPPVPFAAANLCLSSLLLGLSALGESERTTRLAADRALLGTAPVGRARVVAARAAHAGFHLTLLTIGMALPPAILLAWLVRSPVLVPAYLLAACACSGLAAGAFGTALRWSRRWLGRPRTALLSGSLKALVFGGGVVLFALGLPALDETADALPIGRLGAELLPPYHAAKLLYALAAGDGSQAWRLLPLLSAGALLAVLGALAGEEERAGEHRVGRGGPLRSLLRRLAGAGPRLAVAEFTATMLWRSPGFRARVLPLLGMPTAMVFLALRGDDEGLPFLFVAQQFPAIYLPFLVAFLPRAEQPGARFVFDQAPAVPLDDVRDAAWRALVTHVLVPVHALALALLPLAGLRFVAALPGSLFALGLGVIAARPMVQSLEAIPFTDEAEAEVSPQLGGLFATGIVLAAAGVLFAALGPGARWGLAAAALAAASFLLARRR